MGSEKSKAYVATMLTLLNSDLVHLKLYSCKTDKNAATSESSCDCVLIFFVVIFEIYNTEYVMRRRMEMTPSSDQSND